MAILVRKDASKLSAISKWEPALLWYAKAVAEMVSRPATDPTSWRFQAGIHGYNKNSDPLVKAGPLPTKAVQVKFWNKCQHGSWFFLPWHRMYLGFFEQIVRAAVVKVGGSPDWTLPYWNYSDTSNANARTLPPAFLEPKLPDGSPNPLFVIQGVKILRAPAINAGKAAAIPIQDVDLTACLGATFFSPDTDTTAGDLGFGGPAGGANHDGQFFGPKTVESLPHNAIHMDVGGQVTLGWMTNPDTAALDPIFWLHHANIDRLWSVWNGISTSNTDPSTSVNVGGRNISWSTTVKFTFNNAARKVVTMTPSQVVDTKTTPFAYDYEDTKNPLAIKAKAAVAGARRGIMKFQPRAEMVGASSGKVTLTGSPQTTTVAIREPSGPAKGPKAARAVAPALGQTYLQIENVVSKKSHATYEVYVNLPGKADSEESQKHYAGALHLFGVRHASTKSAEHAGSGLNFSLDITELADALKAKNAWDEKNVQVTFVPRGQGGEARRAIPEHDPIRIGRISVYQQ
ncbi:MAG: tyrosinase family protein [Bryobacteraceae bacterium]